MIDANNIFIFNDVTQIHIITILYFPENTIQIKIYSIFGFIIFTFLPTLRFENFLFFLSPDLYLTAVWLTIHYDTSWSAGEYILGNFYNEKMYICIYVYIHIY